MRQSWRTLGTGLLLLGVIAPLGACRQAVKEEPVKLSSVGDVPDSAWVRLGARRVFFGHQSVGDNIVEGVTLLALADPRVGVRVVPAEDAPDSGGAFLHARIGRNGDPGAKTDDFARWVEGPLGGRVHVAFHKYCYADITAATDVPAVFERYRQTMERLRAECPGVEFVHVTTPLVVIPSGPKTMLKTLLGRSPLRFDDNLARERFNDLMRRTYAGREPLFDLAEIESTRPNGDRETVRAHGQLAHALVPAYSADGSHLNQAGMRRVAEELLVFLAQLPESR